MEYISDDNFYKLVEEKNFYELLRFNLLNLSQLTKLLEIIDSPSYYWEKISKYQVLSESFIEKYADKIDWYHISMSQVLSESFIEKYQDKVDWASISYFQKLSESFIEKFQNKVCWEYISICQKLSESFIMKFLDKISWRFILQYQKLSESFIKDNIEIIRNNSIYVDLIAHYQEYSNKLAKEYNLLKSFVTYKKRYNHDMINKIIKSGKYECHDDYFIAYKAVRADRYSLFNFQYKYLPNETYESSCDCTKEEDSFGLNVGTYKFVESYLGYDKGLIIKCKINFNDVGRVVHDGKKIRCFKITIID